MFDAIDAPQHGAFDDSPDGYPRDADRCGRYYNINLIDCNNRHVETNQCWRIDRTGRHK